MTEQRETFLALIDAANSLTRAIEARSLPPKPVTFDPHAARGSGISLALRKAFHASAMTPADMLSRIKQVK